MGIHLEDNWENEVGKMYLDDEEGDEMEGSEVNPEPKSPQGSGQVGQVTV